MNLKSTILRLVSLTFLVQIALSQLLWFDIDRTFPLVSLVPLLKPASLFFSSGLVLSLVYLLFVPSQKRNIYFVLFFLLFSVLVDINCLQPWVWFYFILLVLCLFEQEKMAFKSALLFFLAAFYLWSGLNKLNIWYATSEFPWFLSTVKPLKLLSHLRIFSYGSAVLEAVLGLGLLFPKIRKWAIGALIIFHFHVLTLLSPIGLNWNMVVWPWNVFLMLMLYLLFKAENDTVGATRLKSWSKSDIFSNNFLGKNSAKWLLPTVVLLPLIGFFGFFEKNMSFYLYTGMNSEATLYWPKEQKTSLPSNILDLSYERVGILDKRLQLDDWAMRELHVPPYNSLWALKKMAGQAANTYLPAESSSGYFTLKVRRWDTSNLETQSYARPVNGF